MAAAEWLTTTQSAATKRKPVKAGSGRGCMQGSPDDELPIAALCPLVMIASAAARGNH